MSVVALLQPICPVSAKLLPHLLLLYILTRLTPTYLPETFSPAPAGLLMQYIHCIHDRYDLHHQRLHVYSKENHMLRPWPLIGMA